MSQIYRIDENFRAASPRIPVGDGVLIQVGADNGKQLRDIVMKHLPEWAELFFRKNAEYGENASVLGDRGQFADMWRKMGKLKTAMWDGHEDKLVSEGVDEILMDLIGHCFLTLQIREEERQILDKERLADSGVAGVDEDPEDSYWDMV